jgi:DNA (cytosine-5)-methyltransferase 1
MQRFVIGNPLPFVVPQSIAPVLIQTGYGEREGQAPRALDLHQPLGTVVAGGIKHALVAAFLAKHYGGVVGVPLDGRPLDTITTTDHHSLVTAFLTAYYSSTGDAGQSLTEPARTITTKDRLGLVTIEGSRYTITDIGLRMLAPHELLRAQFGRFAANYDLGAATTKTDKVRLIGNSVAPEVAEALVAANCPRVRLLEAAE